jgi:hypothetical protein
MIKNVIQAITEDEVGVVKGALAQFDNPADLLHAAEKVREAGYTKWDTHSPFPVHGMDDAMGLKPSKLGWIVAICGFCGGSGAMLLQWWVATHGYALNISGKPLFSMPAFIPVTFELTILASAFAAVFGMFAFNMLPRFHHPVFYSDRFKAFSDDGFFISVEVEDDLFFEDKTQDFLKSLGPSHVELVVSN